MKKAKTLTDDPAGRWLKGEVGILLQCDFDKYDYCVDFGTLKDQELFGKKIGNFRRIFYFYEDEIEIVSNDTPTTRVEVVTTTIQTLRLKL